MSEFSFDGGQRNHRAYLGPRPTNMRSALQSSLNTYLRNSLEGRTNSVMGIPEEWMWNKGNRGGSPPPTTGGNDPGVDPNDPNDPNNPSRFAWKFPQYSQTWAFTPPTPTPYQYPQPFDTSIYGNPLKK